MKAGASLRRKMGAGGINNTKGIFESHREAYWVRSSLWESVPPGTMHYSTEQKTKASTRQGLIPSSY